MPVGNDLVALADSQLGAPALRYLQRVCTAQECTALDSGARPFPRDFLRRFWSYYAAKEAMYKLAVKLGAKRQFVPRHFEVNATLDEVRYAGEVFELRVAHAPHWLHAVVLTRDSLPLLRVAKSCETRASHDVRQLAIGALSSRFGYPRDALAVVRADDVTAHDGFGPPAFELSGSKLQHDLSLSHHGQFVACAIDVSRAVA